RLMSVECRKQRGAFLHDSHSCMLTLRYCDPAADAAGIDAQEVGDLKGGVALADALHGQQPPTLQLSGCSYASHARTPGKPQAERALLSSEPIADRGPGTEG